MFGKKAQPPIKSLIAQGSRIDGNLQFTEGLRIDGEVVGDTRANTEQSSILVISESAVVQGEIHADHVIIAGVFNLEDAKTYGDVMNVQRLVANIAATGKPAETLPDADAIVENLAPAMKDGDVIAIMSNGGFGGIHEKILDQLKSKKAASE